jgi:integrase
MHIHKLTKKQVEDAVAKAEDLGPNKRTSLGDGGGLQLQASATGASWNFRFEINGRSHLFGLGAWPTISLDKARQRAQQARQQVSEGINPIEQKRAQRAAKLAEVAKQITFGQVVERYIKAHTVAWSPKNLQQTSQSLRDHAVPKLGKLFVTEVTKKHIMSVLVPLWDAHTPMAVRLRGRLELIFIWAKQRDILPDNFINPAELKNLGLPKASEVYKSDKQAALPYKQVPTFMAALRDRPGIAARALEFDVLTCSRADEVKGSTWSEVEGSTWTMLREVKGKGHKRAAGHQIPLSDRAIAILSGLRPDIVNPAALIFDGLGPNDMLACLRDMGYSGAVASVHGFRSSYSDWFDETTDFPVAMRELSLSHKQSSAVIAAYSRSDLLQRRVKLAAAWADYCASPVAEVVALMEQAP